jgi:hypothetical protein
MGVGKMILGLQEEEVMGMTQIIHTNAAISFANCHIYINFAPNNW